MKAKHGKAVSIPSGLGYSLLINAFITMMGVIILSVMLDRNRITWENVGYWIMVTLFAASFCGGRIAITTIKTQKYLISLMSGLLYWVFLLCITALFFGGQFSSVPETVLLILSGTLSAALLYSPRRKTAKNFRNFNR